MLWTLIWAGSVIYLGVCHIWHDSIIRPYFKATEGLGLDKKTQKEAVGKMIPMWKKMVSLVLYFPLNVATLCLAVIILCLIAAIWVVLTITNGIIWVVEYVSWRNKKRKFKKYIEDTRKKILKVMENRMV